MQDKSKKSISDPILQFANATPFRASQLIRCGFEFEFHELNGLNNENLSDSYIRAQFDKVWERDPIILLEEYGDDSSSEFKALAALNDLGFSLNQLRNKKLREKLQKYLDTEKKDTWDECLRDPYNFFSDLNGSSFDYKYEDRVAGFSAVTRLAECGDDGSVRGGEIRTKGARTVTQFRKVAKVLTGKKNKWTVDLGCSFHIHLSLPGVKHKWGERFQAEMYAYLITQLPTLPRGVQDRVFSKGRQWAKFELGSGGKSKAVHRHHQGTWEFRLFGGISKYEDMNQCLSVAIATLQHAYRVRAGIVPSILGAQTTDSFQKALYAVYNLPTATITQLQDTLRKYRNGLDVAPAVQAVESDAA